MNIEVSKTKQGAYDDLYARLGRKEGETGLQAFCKLQDFKNQFVS